MARQHRLTFINHKPIGGTCAKPWEGHITHGVMVIFKDQRHLQGSVLARGLFLQVPFALFAPAEADCTIGRNKRSGVLRYRHGFPFGIVFLAQSALQIAGPQLPAGNEVAIALFKLNQHRHVGVTAAIILEIPDLPVEMEFTQDHMAHSHAKGGIGALLHIEPNIGKLGSFSIIR